MEQSYLINICGKVKNVDYRNYRIIGTTGQLLNMYFWTLWDQADLIICIVSETNLVHSDILPVQYGIVQGVV